MGRVRLDTKKGTITSIDVVVMHPFVIFSLVQKIIFHKGIIKKQAIIFQYIIDTHSFGEGYIDTVELQMIILLVWVGGI